MTGGLRHLHGTRGSGGRGAEHRAGGCRSGPAGASVCGGGGGGCDEAAGLPTALGRKSKGSKYHNDVKYQSISE